MRRELAPPPIKAPPAHVFNAREQLLDVAVIKAPPAHVFNAPDHLLKAQGPPVIAVLEQPRPKNTAVAVVRGG